MINKTSKQGKQLKISYLANQLSNFINYNINNIKTS